jgi:3-hydroxyisobutyrate dehydrogenase-like beta-hydroxyacid dehydrogenase
VKIGFVGVGVMGSRMARNLVKAGHELTVHDANAETTAAVAKDIGAKATASPREAAAASEIVITMLPNGQVVREVVFGENGLAAGFKPGSLLLDTSSAEPGIAREIAERLATQKVDMVDAPVSGAEAGARTATLVFMCGGSDAGLARARPILEKMGTHIFHVGPLSAGHTMKAITNVTTALSIL